jgi:hypothetical protein
MVSPQSRDEALDGVWPLNIFGPAGPAGKAPVALDGLAVSEPFASTAD